ncbi:MAG: DEAD/DEAH box helicase [Deltaproteobacteria bacterium]|nr:DEAD/DEAH box helicase [Deltaproteobacteria bacterium]
MQLDLEAALDHFPVVARVRGREYAAAGRVQGLVRTGAVLRADVRGRARYRVTWQWAERRGWVGTCSCPVHALCKHLYAVALEALLDSAVLGAPESGEGDDLDEERVRALETERLGPALGSRWHEERGVLAEALRELREHPEPWRREGALATLLSHDRMMRLRLNADRALAEALAEEDPDVRCWKLVRVIESVPRIECPSLLVPYRDRPDLEARAAEVSRQRVLARLAAWTAPGATPAAATTRRLRVAFSVARDGKDVVILVEARVSSKKLHDAPRRLDQLEQLLAECRGRPDVLQPRELSLLLLLVQLRLGGIESAPISHHPAALRRLLEHLHESPLGYWDTASAPELAASMGVVHGAPVRLGPMPASIVPACEDTPAGPVLGLRLLLGDGRAAALDAAVLCPPPTAAVRRGDGLGLFGGTFWPVVGEPPAPLLAELSARGAVPLDLERDAPLLRPLALRFPSVASGLAAHTRVLRVRSVILADLRDEAWLHLRLLAYDAGVAWEPGAAFPDGAAAFEHRPGLGFAPADLADATRSAHSGDPTAERPASNAPVGLEMPEPSDVDPALTWLSTVLGGEEGHPAERYQSVPGHWLPATGATLDRFAEAHGALPPSVRIYATPHLRKLLDPQQRFVPRLRVTGSGIDFFEISAAWEEAAEPFSAAEISALREATTRFVRLSRGWVARAAAEGQQDVLVALADIGVEPGTEPECIGLAQLAGASDRSLQTLAACGMSEESRAAVEALRTRIAGFEGVPRLASPPGLTADLRPYQREGVDFLVHASSLGLGAVLADDMGLGKTLQALAWLLHLRAGEGDPGPALVVCPTSLLHNWRREAERFAPGLRVAVLERGSERHVLRSEAERWDLLLTNYALLRRDVEAWEKIDLNAAILDEAQNVKNPEAAVSKAVRRLRARHRLALTGTPLENRPLDLWSLVSFVSPGLLGGQRAFVERYEGSAATPLARARLAAKLRPVLIRRLKSEVAKDLPDRIEERRDCELSPEQRRLYLAELRRTRALALRPEGSAQEEARRRIAVLAALTRLRQICCHAALVGGRRSISSGKVDALFEILEPLLAEGHKVLVFSQFVKCLEILRHELTRRAIPHHVLTGESVRRDRIIAAFEAEEGASVFLISLKAGGTGLNLTAASYVVLFDPWWNPAVEAQAIDRTHRIGQHRTVVAYRLVARGTIEERIFELQQQKAAMVRDVLGEEGFARSLSRDDLAYLLDAE